MSMTLQDVRNFVRGYPDIDAEDLADAVLDVFVREGFNRIAASERTWQFYQVQYELTTAANVQGYALSALGSYTIADVSAVVGTQAVLRPAPHQTASQTFPTERSTTGRPIAWSLWASSIYLWPKPDAVYVHQVYGYREPIDWVAAGAGTAVDLPADMHELVALWALSRTYAQQDDIEAATQFRESFERQLVNVRGKHLGTGPAVPVIVGGGTRQVSRYGTSLYPPRFTWR